MLADAGAPTVLAVVPLPLVLADAGTPAGLAVAAPAADGIHVHASADGLQFVGHLFVGHVILGTKDGVHGRRHVGCETHRRLQVCVRVCVWVCVCVHMYECVCAHADSQPRAPAEPRPG